MMHIDRRATARYFLLPELMPRIRELFLTGFEYIPFFIAAVFSVVGLLPSTHPYMNGQNIGRFGIRHVIVEAARRLTWSWRHIDQILLFATIVLGMVIVVIQLLFLAGFIFIQPVFASGIPTNIVGFITTPAPAHDLAFMMLDMVFGVPEVFNSCVADTSIQCVNGAGDPVSGVAIDGSGDTVSWGMDPATFPMAAHDGLHAMFNLYSISLLVISTMIFSYLIVTVIAETMQTGQPFGKRYNHVWAPVRMVVAFGLLMPISQGLNSSQYIVLYAAKYGSSFATQGWLLFNNELNSAFSGTANTPMPEADNGGTGSENLVATVQNPQITALLQFMHAAKTCAYGEAIKEYSRSEGAYSGIDGSGDLDETIAGSVGMYLVKDATAPSAALHLDDSTAINTLYSNAINFLNGAQIANIYIGIKEAGVASKEYLGGVRPVCGHLQMKISDPRSVSNQRDAYELIQKFYIGLLREVWFDTYDELTINYVKHEFSASSKFYDVNSVVDPSSLASYFKDTYSLMVDLLLNGDTASTVFTLSGNTISIPAGGVRKLMADGGDFSMDSGVAARGWAGAALWYNRVAELNGKFVAVSNAMPAVIRYPQVMEEVAQLKAKGAGTVDIQTRFKPEDLNGSLSGGDEAFRLATAYWNSYFYWQKSGAMENPHMRPSGNSLIDIINALIGTSGIFNMRDDPDVHPLAQLSSAGRALIDASINNLTRATAAGASGLLISQASQGLGTTAEKLGSFLVTIAMLAMAAGFVMYYIIPFLPFIYFMFSFGGWIKGIFEAMVGAPLWALAHIRIDGHGLSGRAALSGYLLIFEIFLRPILMVFGLLASISIFSALVYVMNMVFDLVVANAGGFDIQKEMTGSGTPNLGTMRNSVDTFFYTIMYAVIVYIMGMASFKLIDLIPNNILRWMGQSVTTFNDQNENAAEGLVGRAMQGSQQASQGIGGSLKSFMK
ncbi:MAG: hypothetical protein CMH26_04595 [Micavibrio sp.]|nr:hypothetical protein [Micavibrio sp.]|tara:strand:+ start:687 stop:3542 length:2856 start_codon:yes stop_codon:yes gene_type:complete